MATTSTPSRHAWGRSASQCWNACLGAALDHVQQAGQGRSCRGPGCRSMMTVTYLSPRRVCRQTCSSTPITATPSNRAGSAIRTRLAFGQHRVVGGVPRHPQRLRRSGPRSGVGTQWLPAPTADRAATTWPAVRPPRRCLGATHGRNPHTGSGARDQQRGGPPPERLMRQPPSDGVARAALFAAAPTPPSPRR